MGEGSRTFPQISHSPATKAFPEGAELGCSTVWRGRLTELGSNGSPWSGAKPGGPGNTWLVNSVLQLRLGLAHAEGWRCQSLYKSQRTWKGPKLQSSGADPEAEQCWVWQSIPKPQVLLHHPLLRSTFTSL